MTHTVRRDKKLIEYIEEQCSRVGMQLSTFFKAYVFISLRINPTNEIDLKNIFKQENVLIETLKLLGILEVAHDRREFDELLQIRRAIRDENENYTLNDFDKVLKGILMVPKPGKKK